MSANLDRANLSGADLTAATLRSASLKNADLQRATLARVNADSAQLHGAQLDHANLAGGSFVQATLDGAQLDWVTGTDLDLSQARASHVDFAMSNLTGARAVGATLRGSNFWGTTVHRTSFGQADLSEANFHGAHFHDTSLASALISGTNFFPSNVAHDQVARKQLFERVYSHVNAYGSSSNTCSGTGSDDDDSVRCTGENDDPSAVMELAERVEFGWGSVNLQTQRRRFYVQADIGSWAVGLEGVADRGLGSFWVHSATGTIDRARAGLTHHVAAAGEIGGPLKIFVGHHGGIYGGYHLNVSGWVQRGWEAGGALVGDRAVR